MDLSIVGRIEELFTFPIKGLSPVAHQHIELQAGEGFPGDRLFGFAKGNSGFDPNNPKPLPKHRFLVLMQHAKIAGLSTSFDPATYIFTATEANGQVFTADLSADGERAAAAFFADYLGLEEAETPFFASAAPHRFTDVSVVSPTMMNAVSLINLASVRAFAARIAKPVDPMRFRGNILFDGWPAFAELDLVGETITVGATSFRILLRTKRCPATEVNPATAERDIPVPKLLQDCYGHSDMGVYAEVISDGDLKIGDSISLSG